MYVVARARQDRVEEVQAYLYSGQKIIGQTESRFGTFLIVESAHGLAGRMLADRLASGMFGAREFATLQEAREYIESEL
jgi:hypothetical protein